MQVRLSLNRGLGITLLFAVIATGCFASSASASDAHFFSSSFGPDGTEGSEFVWAGAVGVDQQSHDVYVADLELGTVSKFDEGGSPVDFSALASNEISGFVFFPFLGFTQIAVDADTSRFYVTDNGANSIKAFEQDGEPAEFSALASSEISGLAEPCGVAVDENGAIYVGQWSGGLGAEGVVAVFAPSGTEITSFETEHPCNVAVGSNGNVYANHFESYVEKFTPSAFPVTGTTEYPSSGPIVNEGPVYALALDPSNDDLYADHRTEIEQYDEGGSLITTFPAPGDPGQLTLSEGIAVDGVTGNVFVSDAQGEKRVEIFVPPPPEPPSVGQSSFSNVTDVSADLQAQVTPEFFETHYRFQYVTMAQFEASGFAGAAETPDGNLGSAGTVQTARAHIGGLTPDTTYLFRVAAENQNNEGSPVFSPETKEFTTFPPAEQGLPDGRFYEMVSPPQKAGEVFPPEPNPVFSGSCPKECLPGGNAQLMPMQSSPDGQALVYQGQPFFGGLAAGPNEYLAKRAPSGWGTQSLSSPQFGGSEGQGYGAFSDDLSRGVLYQIEPALSLEAPTSDGKSFANLYLWEGDAPLQPLVIDEPPQRDSGRVSSDKFRIGYAGANAGTGLVPGFSHVIFEANDALTPADPPNAPAAPLIGSEERNLYEWADGELQLVNVLPGNIAAASGAVIGSGYGLSGGDETEGADFDQAISGDGSRIFWSEEGSGQVYVRIDGVETRKIEDPGKFLVASSDGSEVLLSDGCLYDVEAETCEDLTDGAGGFQGILGAAEDLSRVYFVDTEVLTGGEENANGEQAEATKFNLYTWSEDATAFIGTLFERDNTISSLPPAVGDWRPSSGSRLAQVSPDGAYLAFMSQASLTGYDNNLGAEETCFPAPKGSPTCYEVFQYDAIAENLTCVSCNPTGEPPLGSSNLSLIYRGQITKAGFPQPGNLTAQGQGRLFFESQDDLSPHDTNGRIQDVYEWEPSGVGGCQRAGGCVSLISSGHSLNDSIFLNATPNGDDVFIVTREQLLAQDKDEKLDLYDARVGGGIQESVTPPCNGEACLGPIPSPPAPLGPGSGEASDPGNVKPKPKPRCKRGFVRKHGNCVKKKQKGHHKRSANRDRGGSK